MTRTPRYSRPSSLVLLALFSVASLIAANAATPESAVPPLQQAANSLRGSNMKRRSRNRKIQTKKGARLLYPEKRTKPKNDRDPSTHDNHNGNNRKDSSSSNLRIHTRNPELISDKLRPRQGATQNVVSPYELGAIGYGYILENGHDSPSGGVAVNFRPELPEPSDEGAEDSDPEILATGETQESEKSGAADNVIGPDIPIQIEDTPIAASNRGPGSDTNKTGTNQEGGVTDRDYDLSTNRGPEINPFDSGNGYEPRQSGYEEDMWASRDGPTKMSSAKKKAKGTNTGGAKSAGARSSGGAKSSAKKSYERSKGEDYARSGESSVKGAKSGDRSGGDAKSAKSSGAKAAKSGTGTNGGRSYWRSSGGVGDRLDSGGGPAIDVSFSDTGNLDDPNETIPYFAGYYGARDHVGAHVAPYIEAFNGDTKKGAIKGDKTGGPGSRNGDKKGIKQAKSKTIKESSDTKARTAKGPKSMDSRNADKEARSPKQKAVKSDNETKERQGGASEKQSKGIKGESTKAVEAREDPLSKSKKAPPSLKSDDSKKARKVDKASGDSEKDKSSKKGRKGGKKRADRKKGASEKSAKKEKSAVGKKEGKKTARQDNGDSDNKGVPDENETTPSLSISVQMETDPPETRDDTGENNNGVLEDLESPVNTNRDPSPNYQNPRNRAADTPKGKSLSNLYPPKKSKPPSEKAVREKSTQKLKKQSKKATATGRTSGGKKRMR